MYRNNHSNERANSEKIYLVDQSSWLPWLNIIKAKARRGCKQDIWQYIDPSKSSQPELPESPVEPKPSDIKLDAMTILDLDPEQFAKFQYLEKRYDIKLKQNTEIIHSIQEIDSYIMGSIQFDNELWTRDVDSTWALLRALQKRLSPTIQSRKIQIIRAYNALKIYNKQQSVDRFLYEWERVYGLAVSVGLPDVMDERPLYDFALSLDKIDANYATNLELRIDENVRQRSSNVLVNTIQLEDVIEEFRHYYSRHQATRAEKEFPTSFATSHNDIRAERKPCLCGNSHPFKECYYLNPSLRPEEWIGKETTYQKINQALADPKRIKIKTLIQKTSNYDGGPKGLNNITNKGLYECKTSANAVKQEQETDELLNSYHGNKLNFAALAANQSLNTLKNSWILDGGSDVHICNNSKKWDFKIMRKAERGDSIRAGNSSVPIDAYGTVKVKVDTMSGKKHITLENVILSNGFLTNIVSMQLINNSEYVFMRSIES
ncbi:Ribonuclease h-like domain [Thalictrum thalictroides]|uniref:Ribonuclease h-like domain n=1 Tax=Thalictrum thalictroides TaxID=46969 RepID=A0A7J6VXW2_THATH|nr:Ribonuclease h-like domain [Thalictrum thalictroides]